MYEFLSSHELRREPGARFEYSNLGFQLLGHALARAAGMSYTELHREWILVPLGMTTAGFTLDGERAEWAANGHRNGAVVSHWTGTEARLGAGGLFADVEDMLKYLKANVGPPGTELEEAMQMAHEARLPWGEGGARIGLAWTVDSVQGRRPAIQEFQVTPGALASFVGEYTDPSGSSLHVRLENEGYLTIQSPRRARIRVYAESDTSFTLDRGSVRMIFEKGEDDEVLGVRMEPSRSGEIARKVRDDSPTPRAVAAGDQWQGVGIEWQDAYWVLFGGLALLAVLTLGAEVRRILRRRSKRGS
jgi:hypothetical protein